MFFYKINAQNVFFVKKTHFDPNGNLKGKEGHYNSSWKLY